MARLARFCGWERVPRRHGLFKYGVSVRKGDGGMFPVLQSKPLHGMDLKPAEKSQGRVSMWFRFANFHGPGPLSPCAASQLFSLLFAAPRVLKKHCTTLQVPMSRLATGVGHLRHDQMEQGPTEPHAGRGMFLLSSGGAGGGYY